MAKMRETIQLPSDTTTNSVADKAKKTAVAMIELPVLDHGGFSPQAFNFRISRQEAEKLRLLRESLHKSGATYFDGRIERHVDRPHDTWRWLLSQIQVS